MPKASADQRNRALCCKCGNLRTVAAGYSRVHDVNRTGEENRHPEGWRCTSTLKCAVCKAPTVHALLRDFLYDGRPDDTYRDIAEYHQHLTPGQGGFDRMNMPPVGGRF